MYIHDRRPKICRLRRLPLDTPENSSQHNPAFPSSQHTQSIQSISLLINSLPPNEQVLQWLENHLFLPVIHSTIELFGFVFSLQNMIAHAKPAPPSAPLSPAPGQANGVPQVVPNGPEYFCANGSNRGGIMTNAQGDIKTKYPPAERIVAIGDVHGDINALRQTLKMCNVLGPNDEWTGGKTVLVQVGDQLDRGDSELAVLRLLFKLQDEARPQGGQVHILLGNHELMNAEHDFRYVTAGGFADFAEMDDIPVKESDFNKLPAAVQDSVRNMPQWMRPRALAMRPGGPISVRMANRMLVSLIVGENLFVHGGLKPEHLIDPDALESMNKATRSWLLGKGEKPAILRGGKSPVWMRNFSRPSPEPSDCAMLGKVLQMTNTKRMIVGHTPQAGGINAACTGRVWRTDTGMAAAYGGVPEVLEITPKRIRVLTPKGVASSTSRMRR